MVPHTLSPHWYCLVPGMTGAAHALPDDLGPAGSWACGPPGLVAPTIYAGRWWQSLVVSAVSPGMQKPWLLVEHAWSIISPGIWDFSLLHHQQVCGPSLRITDSQRPWGLQDTEPGLDSGERWGREALEVCVRFHWLVLLAWVFWAEIPALS